MPVKLSDQDIDRRIQEDGRGFVRTTESNGAAGNMGWRCPIGHKWIATPNNVLGKHKQGCPHCIGKHQTNEKIDERIAEDGRGFERITDYAGMAKPMGWRCPEGHEWKAAPNDVLGINRNGCPHCAGNAKKSNDDIDHLLVEDGRGFIRTTDYRGMNRKLGLRCSEGHAWSATPASVLRNKNGCPHCAGKIVTAEDIDTKLQDQGRGTFRIDDYKGMLTRITWGCPEGHTWKATPAVVLHNNAGCPHCSGNAKRDNDQVDRILLEDGRGYVRTTIYTNSVSPMGFKCPKGHEWITAASSVLWQGTGCPECGSTKLTNEDYDRILLEDGRGYIRTTDGQGVSNPMGFLCPNGHVWTARPDSVLGLQKTGCPNCSLYGFDPGKPAYTYFMRIESRYTIAYKVGISNNGGDVRSKNLQARPGVTITVIGELYFENGSDALAMEQRLHAEYAQIQYPPEKGKELIGNGYTELFTQDIWALENRLGTVKL